MAYNLDNFLGGLVPPTGIRHWLLTALLEKLIKIGVKIVHHVRYVTFRMAEAAVPRTLIGEILRRIERLKRRPPSLAPG